MDLTDLSLPENSWFYLVIKSVESEIHRVLIINGDIILHDLIVVIMQVRNGYKKTILQQVMSIENVKREQGKSMGEVHSTVLQAI